MKKYLVAIAVGLLLPFLLSWSVQASPRLTDQQIGVLVAFNLYPDWVQRQAAQQTLVYGVVKPDDRVPSQVANDSYLIADGGADDSPIIYYRVTANDREVLVTVAHRHGKLKTSRIKLRRLVHRFYRTTSQRRQDNAVANVLRTE